MTDDSLSTNRRDVLKLLGVGAAGSTGLSANGLDAVSPAAAAGGGGDCSELNDRQRPVWVADGYELSERDVERFVEKATGNESEKYGEETALAHQSLQYIGSRWINDIRDPEWSHRFTLTTIALSAIEPTDEFDDCPGAFHGDVVESVDTTIDAGTDLESEPDGEYWADITWDQHREPNYSKYVADTGDPGALLTGRPGTDQYFDSSDEFEIVLNGSETNITVTPNRQRNNYRETHVPGPDVDVCDVAPETEFAYPTSELITALAKSDTGEFSTPDYSEVLSSAMEERGSDFWDVAQDGLILGGKLLVAEIPYFGRVVDGFDLAKWGADMWEAFKEDHQKAVDEQKTIGKSVSAPLGMAPLIVQQCHFEVTTDPAADETINLFVDTDVSFQAHDLSDRNLEWHVEIEPADSPPETSPPGSFSIGTIGRGVHRSNLATVRTAPGGSSSVPEISDPAPSLRPRASAAATLDGELWPEGSRPDFTSALGRHARIGHHRWDVDVPDTTVNPEICVDEDQFTQSPDLDWSPDEAFDEDGRTSTGFVAHLVQNEAGLTGIDGQKFDVVPEDELPNAVIDEPFADAYGATDEIQVVATSSTPGETNAAITEYRWDLVSEQTGEHLPVGSGETDSFSAGAAGEVLDGTEHTLKLTVTDEDGQRGTDSVGLTIETDDRPDILSGANLTITAPNQTSGVRIGDGIEVSATLAVEGTDVHQYDEVTFVIALSEGDLLQGGAAMVTETTQVETGYLEAKLDETVSLTGDSAGETLDLDGPFLDPNPGQYNLKVYAFLGDDFSLPQLPGVPTFPVAWSHVATRTTTVDVFPESAPDAVIDGVQSEDFVRLGEELDLDGTASQARNSSIADWWWAITDEEGNQVDTIEGESTSTATVSASRYDPGEHSVILNVTDEAGNVGAARESVKVVDEDYESLSVSIAGPEEPPTDGDVTYSAEVEGAHGDVSFTWSFKPSTAPRPVTLRSEERVVDLQFGRPERHTITVTASDDVTTASTTLTVDAIDETSDVRVDVHPAAGAGNGESLAVLDARGFAQDHDVETFEWTVERMIDYFRGTTTATMDQGEGARYEFHGTGGGLQARLEATLTDGTTETVVREFTFPRVPTVEIDVTVEGGSGTDEVVATLDGGETAPSRSITDYDWRVYELGADGERLGTVDGIVDATAEETTFEGPPGRYEATLTATHENGYAETRGTEFEVGGFVPQPTVDVHPAGGEGIDESLAVLEAGGAGDESVVDSYEWTIQEWRPYRRGTRRPFEVDDGSGERVEFEAEAGEYRAVLVTAIDGDEENTSFDFELPELTESDVRLTADVDVEVDGTGSDAVATLDASGSAPADAIGDYEWTVEQKVSGNNPGSAHWEERTTLTGRAVEYDGSVGLYRATLTVSAEEFSAVDSREFSLPSQEDVEEPEPEAAISLEVDDDGGDAVGESSVRLDASDSEWSAGIESYEWTVRQVWTRNAEVVAEKTGEVVTVEGTGGSYSAALTVVGEDGAEGRSYRDFEFPHLDDGEVDLSTDASVSTSGGSATLDASGSSPSDAIDDYEWSIEQKVSGNSTGSAGWTHVTTKSGETTEFSDGGGLYRATLTVSADGYTDSTGPVEFTLDSGGDDTPTPVDPTADASVSTSGGSATLDGSDSSPSGAIGDYEWSIEQKVSGNSTGSAGWTHVTTKSGETAGYSGSDGLYRATLTVSADSESDSDGPVEFSLSTSSNDDGGSDDGGSNDGGSDDGGSDDGGSNDGGSDEPDYCDGLDNPPIGGGPDWSKCNW